MKVLVYGAGVIGCYQTHLMVRLMKEAATNAV